MNYAELPVAHSPEGSDTLPLPYTLVAGGNHNLVILLPQWSLSPWFCKRLMPLTSAFIALIYSQDLPE